MIPSFLHVCCLPGSDSGRWVHTKDPASEAKVLPDGMRCDQAIAVGEALIILILDHATPVLGWTPGGPPLSCHVS